MGQMMSNLGNSNVTDPSQARPGDLDGSEKEARLIAGGTNGFMQGFSNYQNQNGMMRQGGGGSMMPMPQAQPVSPDYFNPQRKSQGSNLAFYGGGQ